MLMRTRSLASEKRKGHERRHHRSTETIRLFPRNGFNGFFRALSGDRAFLPPSLADCSANLMPASRHQDHTTSPSAITPLVCGATTSIASLTQRS
jgi:hypothetical protein